MSTTTKLRTGTVRLTMPPGSNPRYRWAYCEEIEQDGDRTIYYRHPDGRDFVATSDGMITLPDRLKGEIAWD